MSVSSRMRSPVQPPPTTVTHLHPYSRPNVSAGEVARPFATIPLRLFLGLTFIYAALDKIADPGYLDPTSGGAYLGNQLQGYVSSSPIGLTWKIQPYFLAPDSMYAVAWITLALVGDAGTFSLQPAMLRRRLSGSRTVARVQGVLLPMGAAAVGVIWLLAIAPK